MSDEIQSRVIKIDEMSQDAQRVNLKYGRDKYHFWISKKDGNHTKAYENMKELGIGVGDTVEIAFKEEDAVFEKDGKSVPFKRRTILAMKSADGQEAAPASSKSYSAPQPVGNFVSKEEYDKTMGDMRESYLFIAKQLKELKDKFDNM